MEMRKLGSLEISVVGIGCNNFGMRIDADATKAVVDAALEHGINFFDTADVYGGRGKSEEFLGAAIGPRRDEVVIATKFAAPMSDDEADRGGKPDYVKRAVEASLKRLGTDRIDLYQMHGPDPSTPIEDTLSALNELVEAGKVLEIGNSNFNGGQIDEAQKVSGSKGWARFVSAQNNYSLLERRMEPDVTDACDRNGLTILPYFPLASGLLTGKYKRGEDLPEGTRLAAMAQAMPDRIERALSDENFDKVEKLQAFASELGHTLLELAFSWLSSQERIASVIAGATKPEQVASNVSAVSWTLTPDEMAEVDTITKR